MLKAVSYISVSLSIGLFLSQALSAPLDKEPLNVLTWEDFLDDRLVKRWYQETGIPIHQTFYDDEAQRNLVLSGVTAGLFDIAVIDHTSMDILARAEYLYPLTQYQQTEYWPDACGQFGRAYLWGTYGIGYRADKVKEPITSWADLLVPHNSLRGHIGMLGQADELVTSALSALGYPIDSEEDSHLKEAFSLLKQQSHSVITYDYIYSYVAAQPESEEVWVAPMYSGDHEALNELQNTDSWTYVIPKEGSIVWVDCLAIVGASSQKEYAQNFIDYLSRLDISAQNAESLAVATPYIDAASLQSEDFQRNRNVYLKDTEFEDASLFAPFTSDAMLKRIRIKDALIRYYDSN